MINKPPPQRALILESQLRRGVINTGSTLSFLTCRVLPSGIPQIVGPHPKTQPLVPSKFGTRKGWTPVLTVCVFCMKPLACLCSLGQGL